MTSAYRARALALCLFGLAAAWPALAPADPGDAKGWSADTDPRHRVFLKYVADSNGPSLLLIACLRDANSFAIYASGLDPDMETGVELSLANQSKTYHVEGETAPDTVSLQPTFTYEADVDATQLEHIKTELLPVLSGPGPLKLTVGSTTRTLPVNGLKPALARFSSVCFGG